jgi:hypothetical protein
MQAGFLILLVMSSFLYCFAAAHCVAEEGLSQNGEHRSALSSNVFNSEVGNTSSYSGMTTSSPRQAFENEVHELQVNGIDKDRNVSSPSIRIIGYAVGYSPSVANASAEGR